jgi:hypothetical protein
MNYYFTDFTRENYRALLRLAKQGWQFVDYNRVLLEDKCILWRHDCDYSMHAARKLAEIEAEENVSATYFLRMRSEMYNLFEHEIARCVHDIIDAGHEIGLHFDGCLTGLSSPAEMEARLMHDKIVFESMIGKKVEVFSFHNPDAFALSCEDWSYVGMINTYAACFKSEIGYCSDSNGYWRYARLEDVLVAKSHSKLQVLTHPEWWQDEPMAPRARIQRCLEGRLNAVANFYDGHLLEHGRANVSG